ncbi:MAG: hypothetical protein HYZ90_00290, partial [Candidatus Omnitrophica bacterium]|nr:hypothetical protein [Candidatus Omnitrophota bacterium]
MIGGVGLLLTALTHLPPPRGTEGPSSVPTPPPAPSPEAPILDPAPATEQAPSTPPPPAALLRAAENPWRLNGIIRGGDGRSIALIND